MGWESSVRRHTRKGRRPWYTFQIAGVEHHLGTDKVKAYARAGDLVKAAVAGGQRPHEPERVGGLFTDYVRQLGRTPQGCERFLAWACDADGRTMSLTELESADLQRFADWLAVQRTIPRKVKTKSKKPKAAHALSAWSIRHYVADARQMWAWGASQGWAICEPGKVRTPTPVLQPRDEKPAAVKAAIHKLNPRAAAVITFIASVGARPSEARHLRWEQVDLAQSVAVLGEHKTRHTGRTRTIHLPPAVRKLVAEQPRINDYVFNSRLKRPYTKDGLRTVLQRAGIRSSYSLRHTFAQWFLDHGGPGGKPGDKAELQAWLGHADGRMTDVYAQVRDRRLQKVAKRIKGPLGA